MEPVCEFCGKSCFCEDGVWRHRDAERTPVCNLKPKAGKTLADFANSGKIFKRPDHAAPYTFGPTGRDHLKEVEKDGRKHLPRLTAEDLTATDWEEVPW